MIKPVDVVEFKDCCAWPLVKWLATMCDLSCISFYNEDFTYFDMSWVWVYGGIRVCDTIQVYTPCKNPHT
jgi:hypothetical protein